MDCIVVNAPHLIYCKCLKYCKQIVETAAAVRNNSSTATQHLCIQQLPSLASRADLIWRKTFSAAASRLAGAGSGIDNLGDNLRWDPRQTRLPHDRGSFPVAGARFGRVVNKIQN